MILQQLVFPPEAGELKHYPRLFIQRARLKITRDRPKCNLAGRMACQ